MNNSDEAGRSIQTHEDGSRTVRTASGAVLDIAADRNVKLSIEAIQAVGIQNMIDVESHQIVRVAGSTSHFVRFHDGGEVRFAYNDRGKLIELSARECGFTLSDNNELLFKMAQKKPGADGEGTMNV